MSQATVSLAAGFYPARGRATGAAWMLGIGCFGGIPGALIGAELMHQKLGFNDILTLLALPAFFAAGALMIMNMGKFPHTTRPPESM